MNGAKYSVINTMKGPDTATDILTFASAGKSNIMCQINRMWAPDPAENSRYTETQDDSVILHDGEISADCRSENQCLISQNMSVLSGRESSYLSIRVRMIG